ncbi:hypothetical protein KFE25_008233 [Diacronema lutheri]|uniref:Uncharacterized protein n=1 Tax=Diacronema lutheri TaxID=2081491 RepID=A0A8J6CBS7_DIALT|nr:hypothetical protein KFE25_008233 [Diacronema lutheri]
MLYADKRALENNLMVSLIEIRQKELDFYTRNCISIGTQAALLSGFAYAGIIQVAIPESCPDLLKAAYLSMTVCTMTVHLIALFNSTMCAMLGPGLALRGPDGSMHKAVDGMMVEYRVCFLFFVSGVVFFHFSAMLFTWTQWAWLIALPVTTVLFLFLYGIYSHFTRIYNKFQLRPGEMIDGRIVSPAEAAAVAGAQLVAPRRAATEAGLVIHESQLQAGRS